jgi:hypothetical protein
VKHFAGEARCAAHHLFTRALLLRAPRARTPPVRSTHRTTVGPTQVRYACSNFLEKNNDSLDQNFKDLLAGSTNSVARQVGIAQHSIA